MYMCSVSAVSFHCSHSSGGHSPRSGKGHCMLTAPFKSAPVRRISANEGHSGSLYRSVEARFQKCCTRDGSLYNCAGEGSMFCMACGKMEEHPPSAGCNAAQ